MKDFFKGWHKPTVATAAVVILAVLVVYHVAFHARKGREK